MTESEIIAYWSQAATPLGRARLRLRAARKRWMWSFTLGLARLLKRLFDLVVSACALLALLPLFAATAVAIRLESKGPVFFGQGRVGYRGRPFKMWKFRSMVPNADALKDQLLAQNQMSGGVTFKMKNDPRVTKVGRFIRKYSIDELPQFWNVFRGDMSVVGPRPPVPREVALYSPEDRQRLLAQPGLTCFWQVGGRSDIDFAGQVRLDVAYIQSSSVWVDIKLLFLTIPAVLLGKGAM